MLRTCALGGLAGVAVLLLAGLAPFPAATAGTAAEGWSAGAGGDWPIRRRILRVGPGRALATPSAAARIARDGDRIRIDAAAYRDCAVWRHHDLFIEGVGGRPRLSGPVCADQAIWMVRGDRVSIRRVAFVDAHARPNNGAGIKFTGRTMTVTNAVFEDNENGILVGRGQRSRIRISASAFHRNGRCDGACAHGLYVGRVDRLTVVRSSFIAQRIAHHLKSRARFSEIVGNRIADGTAGTASYAIDLPDGGGALIRGNDLQKGPGSHNAKAMIAIAAESATNPPGAIRIEGNRFVNDHPGLRASVVNFRGVPGVALEDNRFSGPGAPLAGAGRVVR